MLYIIFYFVTALISVTFVGGVIYRRISGVCDCKTNLHGKTAIITGANAGIGKEAAIDLASRGARVILACRDLKKAEAVRKWIATSTGNIHTVCRQLDVADLDSVRKFAQEILAKETQLDILINNAGATYGDLHLSRQGHELTLATNHLGHFLLTNLLLGLMKKNNSSRIITVSSVGHKLDNLDFDDLHFSKRSYGRMKAYSQSKLCNVLFTKELARRLQGTGVTANVLHPGCVATDIINRENTIMGFIADLAFRIGTKTAKQGAQTTIHLAVSKDLRNVSGEYFVDCEIANPSKRAKDPELAKKLWEVSEKEVKLTKEEKFI